MQTIKIDDISYEEIKNPHLLINNVKKHFSAP